MTPTQIFVKMILDRWDASIKNFDRVLNALSDEDLAREVSPGKNRGIYLLGHLIAVHDDMWKFIELGNNQYPEFAVPFHDKPDKAIANIPTASELRKIWSKQCAELWTSFNALAHEKWFEKHTAVSAEDFAKEPHRNKLNIVNNRISHLQYHTGQVALLMTR